MHDRGDPQRLTVRLVCNDVIPAIREAEIPPGEIRTAVTVMGTLTRAGETRPLSARCWTRDWLLTVSAARPA